MRRVAAERCALSPAAFSRRIQAFRLFVGREVFDRTPGGMRLTAAGQECLRTLEPVYRNMTEAAIQTTRTAKAIRSGAADLGVCASDVEVNGLHTEHLLDVHVAPVASPKGRPAGRTR